MLYNSLICLFKSLLSITSTFSLPPLSSISTTTTMQYKTLAALLFASAALAAPRAQYIDGDDYLNDDYHGHEISPSVIAAAENYYGVEVTPSEVAAISDFTEDTPSSIFSALATAVPTTWIQSMDYNSDFRYSELSEIVRGTYPAWYSTLPQSVKAWATSLAKIEASMYMSSTPYSTSVSTPCASSTPLGPSYSVSVVTATFTQPATTSSSSSESSSSSSSSSGSQPTSISSAGAPAATGGVAMSLAGAAGILGLAMAL